MKLGLIGAIGGLGKAAETFGSDLIRRREQALEAARREAEYQRSRIDRQEDKAEDRDFQRELLAERERAADERVQATAAARREEIAARTDASFKIEDRKQAGRKELLKLKSQIQKEMQSQDQKNREAALRLADKLRDNNVTRVKYGKPDAEGYADMFGITPDGTQISLGKGYAPKLNFAPEEEDEDEDAL